jgi:hypothetical protein
MPLKAVATSGSVTPSPGTAPDGNTGTWAPPTQITESAYAQLTVEGVAVIWQAKGEFTFTGTIDGSGGSPSIVPPSTVTLTATATVLQAGLTSVLRHGDSESDGDGNTLTVSSSVHLRSD